MVRVNGPSPVFEMTKLDVFVCPGCTDPKLSALTSYCMCGLPAYPLPVSGTDTDPVLDWIVSVRSSSPSDEGWNRTVTATDCCAPIVEPTAGKPETVYGAPGSVLLRIVVDVVPVLVMVTPSCLRALYVIVENFWTYRKR